MVIEGLGRTYLYTYVRQHHHILSRRALYDSYRNFYPHPLSERMTSWYNRRAGWTTPGPDFIWSLDGYDKLKKWGIEIYAGIDAYSRMIVWFYVGVSSGTQRSILGQYINVLEERGKMPLIVRTDHGRETFMAAGAHYVLSQGRIIVQDGIRQDVQLRDCWVFGKSTKNEKIESWWLRLSKGRSRFWRNFAEPIDEERLNTIRQYLKWDHYDLDAYLPKTALEICDKILEGQTFRINEQERPRLSSYLFLRQRLHEYIASNQEPSLSLLPSPKGGMRRYTKFLARRGNDISAVFDSVDLGDNENGSEEDDIKSEHEEEDDMESECEDTSNERAN
ncbi:Uncharacterized protein TPAR_08364 [Tolypocladium paradoxum]|uniref:Integrase core domain-containing protein n=1 Tax=Tolypocladium paradoxum TaxID=94208 RepID=A0A2S4KMQ2_9HYPO|nr:Uncharacterized protein TPAR_08364 [Tolypocladium paradoxum]